MKKLMIVLFVTVMAGAAFAIDNRAMLGGVRPMGMGGAFTAVADDENAFFYNPAGISQREEDPLFQFFALETTLGDIDYFMDYNSEISQSKLNDAQKKNPHAQIALPNIAFISGAIPNSSNPFYFNIGAGLFYGIDYRYAIDRVLSSGKYKMKIGVDTTGIIAVPFSYKFFLPANASIAFGLNGKYIFRDRESYYDVSQNSFNSGKGYGYGLDFGTLFKLDNGFAAGFQISDITETKIQYGSDNSEKIKPQANIGAAYNLYYGGDRSVDKRVIFAADYEDVGRNYEYINNDNFFERFRFGIEMRAGVGAIRVGLRSGYPTFGVGLETNTYQIGYSFYGEQMVEDADPVWIHKIAVAFKIGYNPGNQSQTKSSGNGKSNSEIDNSRKVVNEGSTNTNSNNTNSNNSGNTYNTYNYYNDKPNQ